MGTKITPFNLHTSVDSHVKGLIDSDYIQARQTAGTDSAATIALINAAGVRIPDGAGGVDSARITVGNDSDLKIFHSGNHSFIRDVGTGGLRVGVSQLILENPVSSESMLKATQNGSVELYHDNSKKFETLDSGANVTGNIAANIRSNPKGFSVTHTVDSSDNALLVGPINVDSGVTLTVNGTLMVV